MRFPTVESIRAGRIEFDPDYNTGRHESFLKSFDDDHMAYVRCDDVEHLYKATEPIENMDYAFDVIDNGRMGIIKPPYPALFLEWDSSAVMLMTGESDRSNDRQLNGQAGALIIDAGRAEFDAETSPSLSSLYKDAIFVQPVVHDRGTAYLAGFRALIPYDRYGLYDRERSPTPQGQAACHDGITFWASSWLWTDLGGTTESFTRFLPFLARWFLVPLFAISFMHAKGIGIEWHDVPLKVQAKRIQRGNHSPSSYGIIRLPHLNAPTRPGERGAAAGPPVSAHWVRGHFKTYTDERPLFGSRVGSFWWPPTIRGVGDAKPKPYEVTPSSNT